MDAVILSSALDTNGQNARYVRAAEKHGRDARIIEVLALGNTDPAGVVARFAQAGGEYGLRIRSAHKAQPYFRFPVDILWDGRTDAMVRNLARAADVIHLNNTWRAYKYLGLWHKPALLHHHGSLLRSNPGAMLATARYYRFTQAVSTIDLTRFAPDVLHWLPTAYDIDELARIRRHAEKKSGPVRVVHCPTNRSLKATATLIASVESLRSRGIPVELTLVEGKTNAECLAIKATADIVFDQLAFGYGCNAVEAWGMGIPVIAGADDWTLNAMETRWGGLPFYLADERTLTERLEELVVDRDLRDVWGHRGHEHVNRYHAEKPALERLAELYALTMNARRNPRPDASDPVTFANPKGRPLYWTNDSGKAERIKFPNGQMTTDDPGLIARIRSIIVTRPLWGFEEVTEGTIQTIPEEKSVTMDLDPEATDQLLVSSTPVVAEVTVDPYPIPTVERLAPDPVPARVRRMKAEPVASATVKAPRRKKVAAE